MMQGRFYFPAPLYRVLPLVYICAGVLAPFYISTAMSILSSVLLISAGVLVLMWRSAAKAERRRRARKAHARIRRALGDDSTSISGYSSHGNSDARWE